MTDEELDESFDEYMAEKGESQPWLRVERREVVIKPHDPNAPFGPEAYERRHPELAIQGDPFAKKTGRVPVAPKRPWGS